MLSFCHFQAGTNTNTRLCSKTYAQNSCCAAVHVEIPLIMRYETHSARKSLIHKDSLNCFFSGHSKKTVDLQGLAAASGKLSTKLSTENLENFKTLSNQALRARSANSLEDLSCAATSARMHGNPLKALTSRPSDGENHRLGRRPGAALSRWTGFERTRSSVDLSGLKDRA